MSKQARRKGKERRERKKAGQSEIRKFTYAHQNKLKVATGSGPASFQQSSLLTWLLSVFDGVWPEGKLLAGVRIDSFRVAAAKVRAVGGREKREERESKEG